MYATAIASGRLTITLSDSDTQAQPQVLPILQASYVRSISTVRAAPPFASRAKMPLFALT